MIRKFNVIKKERGAENNKRKRPETKKGARKGKTRIRQNRKGHTLK